MSSLGWIALVGLSASLTHAASFRNLGFDEARTNRVSPVGGPVLRGTGPTEDLLPGRQFAKGGVLQPTLGLNLDSSSLGSATLISSDLSDFFGFKVDGAFALYLHGSPGNQEPFTLFQRGDVPEGTTWLSYSYEGYPLLVNINGTTLTPTLQTSSSQAFDISIFGGQTVDLTLTSTGPLMPTQAGSSFADRVAFTVPEPTPLALLGLGLLVAGTCWLKARRPGL